MFMKKKEEKDLSWYQAKLAQLDEELYVVRKEYETSLAKRYYPEFKDKIGRYYKSEHRYSSRSPFYEYHVLLDVQPEFYYASEIDKYALMQTSRNFPNVIHVGDVRELDASKLGRIDLLIGGSPCTSFSSAGKMNGMSTKCSEEVVTLDRYLELKEHNYEFEGESYLFWEYVRILKELRKVNPDILFLLENVIDSVLGIKGAHINSALVSAQNRRRIYWSNIKTTRYGFFNHDLYTHRPRPADRCIYLRDILEDEVDKKYFISDNMHDWLVSRSKKKNVKIRIMLGDDKSHCITATAIYKGNLDTDYVPDWYKWYCSDTQIYKMLGNGWTVEVIKHIFSFIKNKK